MCEHKNCVNNVSERGEVVSREPHLIVGQARVIAENTDINQL